MKNSCLFGFRESSVELNTFNITPAVLIGELYNEECLVCLFVIKLTKIILGRLFVHDSIQAFENLETESTR